MRPNAHKLNVICVVSFEIPLWSCFSLEYNFNNLILIFYRERVSLRRQKEAVQKEEQGRKDEIYLYFFNFACIVWYQHDILSLCIEFYNKCITMFEYRNCFFCFSHVSLCRFVRLFICPSVCPSTI